MSSESKLKEILETGSHMEPISSDEFQELSISQKVYVPKLRDLPQGMFREATVINKFGEFVEVRFEDSSETAKYGIQEAPFYKLVCDQQS